MIHDKSLHAVVGNLLGAKDAKSTDLVAWWDSRLSTFVLDYPHLWKNSRGFGKNFGKCLLNTEYQEKKSPHIKLANDFMKDKSETAFGFNPASWHVHQILFIWRRTCTQWTRLQVWKFTELQEFFLIFGMRLSPFVEIFNTWKRWFIWVTLFFFL